MNKMDIPVVIKTTARFQEANEPNRQKPIIKIDGAPPTIYQDFNELPNTIRASIDSGRDNPFRPDGKIYKSADPIVDYYKYGPNQSRANSPTDSQLLLNGNRLSPDQSTSSSWFKRKQRVTKKPKRDQHTIDNDNRVEKKSSCWRRVCCCSCLTKCCKKKHQNEAQMEPKTIQDVMNRRQLDEDTKRANDLAREIADDSNKQQDDKNNRQILEKLSGTATSGNLKQTKTVVVKDHNNSEVVRLKNGAPTISAITTQSSSKPNNGKQQVPMAGASDLPAGGADKNSSSQDNGIVNELTSSTVTTTKVKTSKSSKCIVS